MKLLLQNEYQSVYQHDEIFAFEQRFKPKSSEIILDEHYINEVLIFGEIIKNNQPKEKPYKILIINTLNGGPAMCPGVQKWMHNEFYPFLYKIGIRTKAYCLGKNQIAKLSIKLTAEDNPINQFRFDFFNTYERGLNWLKKEPFVDENSHALLKPVEKK